MLRLIVALWAGALVVSAQYDGPIAYPTKSGLGPLYSGFSGGSQGYRDTSYEDNAVTPSPSPSPNPIYRNPTASGLVFRKPSSSGDGIRYSNQQRPLRPGQQFGKGPIEGELEEEKDEPDRLSLLLPQSKFDCVGKQTGYYADEELNCEVFHYCQDNAKHSWICPEGFTFHQVHLICMPPSGDISCKKSSQYHFVNEYLYKPLNLDEAESKPNVTLRYSERYFPSDIYQDERETHEYRVTVPPPVRRPIFLSPSPTINTLPSSGRPSQSPTASTFRIPINQVFRSADEINIPLTQRRPLTPSPSQAVRRYPQIRNDEEDFE